MSDQSPILNLPYILPAQAQKHVSHNEALRILDAIVQLSVESRTLGVPPASPAEGARYIVAAGAVGDWAGKEGQLALYADGLWGFFAPQPGWQAWVVADAAAVVYDGAGWTATGGGGGGGGGAISTLPELGISATADSTNRLSVSSPATLFNHAGAGHQMKLNKAAATDTASLLFQTGFSGRAEMGTMGSDGFSIKVSPDGAAFATALTVASADGKVTLGAPMVLAQLAADPVLPDEGAIWSNTVAQQMKARVGGQVQPLTGQQSLPSLLPPAGEYLLSSGGSGTTTTTLLGAVGRIDLFPYVARYTFDLDQMAIYVTTAVAAALAKIVVYASDDLGRPASLMGETDPIDLSTTGFKYGLMPVSVRQGQTYWLGLRTSSSATVSAWQPYTTPDINGGTVPSTASRKILRRIVTFTTAAPASWGFLSSEITASNPPAIWMRRA